jgi:predicted sulfurtransferase
MNSGEQQEQVLLKGNVLLFYKYVTIEDPETIAQWQRELCSRLNLTGKILIAIEGINATVAGDSKDLTDEYINEMRKNALFSDIDFKESPGRGRIDFESLSVRVTNEIITTNFVKDLHMLRNVPRGIHLSPEQFHQALEKNTEQNNICILDVRNFYESRIGKFENAICPPIRAFSQFAEYVDENLDMFKDKKVYMYCTGGIRCERASAYMKLKGISDVYQLSGGIHRYIEQFPNGKFRGKNYVFDERGYIKANSDVITTCDVCKVTPYDIYRFCSSEGCRTIVIACDICREKNNGKIYCCEECKQYGWKWLKIQRLQKHELLHQELRKRKKNRGKGNEETNLKTIHDSVEQEHNSSEITRATS